MGEITVLKLLSGEEVIGEVVSESLDIVLLKNPAVITLSPTGLTLDPFMVYSNSDVAVFTKAIMAACTVDDKVIEYYHKLFNPTTIVTPEKNIILP